MFSIARTDEEGSRGVTLPDPVRMPEPGDKLVAAFRFVTPAHSYPRGSVLELIERTNEAPHNIKCSLGNWKVKCPYMTSVWSNIEWALKDGILEFAE